MLFILRSSRILAGLLALVFLGLGAGCTPFQHAIDPPGIEQVTACKVASPCDRNRVHIFLIHGLDPFDYANLKGLRDHLHELGFRKTHYGQLFHTGRFEREIRCIHQEDPSARFVLIGFSFGATMVRSLANQALAEGIPIDLLVYMGGNTLKNEPRDQPENVARIVNILAAGCVWNGAWMDRAENIHEKDVFHFGTPSHPYTIAVLDRELAVVAASTGNTAALGDTSEAPAVSTIDAEWRFLEPLPRLGSTGPIRPVGPSR